jgi:hypothetical protein
VTPFSDLESFVIVENDMPETIAKVKERIKLFLIFIINLGETTLPSLGIQVTDGRGKRADFMVPSMWDTYTNRGVSFDSNFGVSYKTPLGKKIEDKLFYRLIGTPESLVDQFVMNGYEKDPVLPQMMHSTRLIYGDESLYSKYRERLSSCSFNKVQYASALLQKDLKKFGQLLSQTDTKSINHKNYIYTPIRTIINGLYFLNATNRECNMFEKIDWLHQNKVINSDQRDVLKESLTLCSFVRLQQYFKYKLLKIDISQADPLLQSICQSNKKLKQIYTFFERSVTAPQQNKHDNHIR